MSLERFKMSSLADKIKAKGEEEVIEKVKRSKKPLKKILKGKKDKRK